MASLNKIMIIGNCGRDVELRYTQSGDPVANVSVAVTEKYKDKENTEWFNVSFFGKTAEVASQYLSKGSPCFIEGRQRTDKYTDKEGNERTAVKLICDRLQLLGGKKDGDTPCQEQPRPQKQAPAPEEFDNGDSIPF